jgi:hypothetical protein
VDNIPCHTHKTKMSYMYCRTCDHLVCPKCISSTHNKHNFEPIDNILSEKLDELKGAEARYCNDLTLCQAKVNEFQISETKCEMISSWWSIIVFSAWSACLFTSQNVFLTVFLSSSISFCSF